MNDNVLNKQRIKISVVIFSVLFALIIYTGVGGIFSYTGELILLTLFIIFYWSSRPESGFALRINTTFADIWVIVIFIYLIYNYIHSYNAAESRTFIIRFLAFFVLIRFSFNASFMNWLLKCIFYYGVFLAVVYIICYPIWGENGGILNSYQNTAISLSIALSIFVARFYSEKVLKINEYISALIILMAIMMTGKRTLFALPVVEAALLFFMVSDKKKYGRVFKIILFGLVAVPIALTLVPSTRTLFTRITEGMQDETLSARTYLWDYALMMWRQKPHLGWGFGTMPYHIEHSGVDLVKYGNIQGYAAHNIYLQMLAEIGTVGLALFAILFIYVLLTTVICIYKKRNSLGNNEKFLLYISFAFQIWFLAYGLTGNPLYMPDECWLYFLAIALVNTVRIMNTKILRFKI